MATLTFLICTILFVQDVIGQGVAIVDRPNDTAVTVGGKTSINCGIENSVGMLWYRMPTDGGGMRTAVCVSHSPCYYPGYYIHQYVYDGINYFELMIFSADIETAGLYACEAYNNRAGGVVTILDVPVCSNHFDGADLVEGASTTLECDVLYHSSPNNMSNLINVYFEDDQGNPIPGSYEIYEEFGHETKRKENGYSFLESVNWTDNGRAFTCYSKMPDRNYVEKAYFKLDVKYSPRNFSLEPHTDGNVYHPGDVINLRYNANPEPFLFNWYLLTSEDWEELEGESDALIVVRNEWSGSVTLRVEVVNMFDHDQDGVRSSQTAEHTFFINVESSQITITKAVPTLGTTTTKAVPTLMTTTTKAVPTRTTAQEDTGKVPAISVLLYESTAISSSPLVFDTVITNIGDSYSEISGVFTVPTHGLYHFSASLISAKNDRFAFQLMRNSDLLCKGYASDADYQTAACSVVVELFPSDEVYVNSYEDDMPMVHGHYFSGLTGFLIQKYQ